MLNDVHIRRHLSDSATHLLPPNRLHGTAPCIMVHRANNRYVSVYDAEGGVSRMIELCGL